jgi:hypothetical protein
VADDRDGAGVDDFLRGERAFLRVGLVVFGDEVELVGPVAELDAARSVNFLDGETRAVLVVLAQVGDAAGQRRDMADLDDFSDGCGRGLGSFRLGCRLFLLAASSKRDLAPTVAASGATLESG